MLTRLLACLCILSLTGAAETYPLDPAAAELMPIEAETVDGRFFALLDLETPGLERTQELVAQQRFAEALDAWRDHLVLKLRGRQAGFFGWHNSLTPPGHQPWADRLVGRESNEQLDDVMNLTGPPAKERQIEWLTKKEPGQLKYYAGWRGFNDLVVTYVDTRDPIYLQKWFEVTSAFCVQQKRQEKALPQEEWQDIMANWDLRSHGQTLAAAARVHNILKSISYFAKALPDGQPGRDWKTEAMLPIDTTLEDGASELIPADQLANIAISLYADHAPFLLDAYEDFGRTPNQRFSGLTALAMIAYTFDEFKASEPLMARAGAAIEDYVDSTVLPDGGDLEQSFNYNQNFVKEGREAVEVFPEDERPHWAEVLEESVLRRERLFAGLVRPFGSLPRIGTYGGFAPPVGWERQRSFPTWRNRALERVSDISGDPLAKQIYDYLLEEADTEPPDFTSIAFPYSGYYAMRDGWTMTSSYLSLIGSRKGTGHHKENINTIAITAYGRPLLTNNGPPPYGPQFLPESQKPAYQEILAYFGERSSRAHNVILVDMESQARSQTGSVRQAYTEPIASRWHTSERYDFAESRYEDGFGKGDQIARVKHDRQVIFVRQLNLWLVTDRVIGDGEPHTYQQMWHFPPPHEQWHVESPGFTDEQVITDEEGKTIRTDDPEGPNIALHQFAPRELTYQRYYGNKDPWLGWYSAGIGGERLPSVDVHTTWQADEDSLVVTALVPSPDQQMRVVESRDLSREGIAGCELMVDGATITWLAAPDNAALQIGEVAVSGEGFLLVERPGEPLTGLALGVTKGAELPRDFEFVVEGGSLRVVSSIEYPDTPDVIAIQPDHGLFLEPVEVHAILPPRPGAELRYTTDGKEPSATSPRFSDSLRIASTTDLIVRPFRNGEPSGPAVTGTYVVTQLPPAPPAPDVHLSTLDPASFKGEAFDLANDTCCYQGHALSIGGTTYDQGISMHAEAEVVYAIPAGSRRFVATVGLDDCTGAKGNVIARVLLDGKQLIETPVIEGASQRFWHLDVALPAAAGQLQLIVEPGPYGGGWHMVDFVNAGFITNLSRPE